MAFVVALENFHGPFDVLLDLLDKNKLEVTSVAVGSITSDYLTYIEQTELSLDELNWFLIVATRLALQKSSALLMVEKRDDEDFDIEASLVRFKKIKELSNQLQALIRNRMLATTKKTKLNSPTSEIERSELRQVYQDLVKESENKPKSIVVKSQQRNLSRLRKKFMAQLKIAGGYNASDIAAKASNRLEAVVGLMTILELLKDGGMKLSNERYILLGNNR